MHFINILIKTKKNYLNVEMKQIAKVHALHISFELSYLEVFL